MLTTFISLLLVFITSTPSSCVSICDNIPSNISFLNFLSSPCNGNLLCMGTVHTTANGTLTLTTSDLENSNQIGRVLYRSPMLAWPASICTTFSFRIVGPANSTRFGDGMTFVLAQDTSNSSSASYGSFMGLFDQSNQRSIRQLAVEFDTYKNEFDPDANHIAIDTNTVDKSVAVQSLNTTGISLTSGREITVRIEYDGWTKNMQFEELEQNYEKAVRKGKMSKIQKYWNMIQAVGRRPPVLDHTEIPHQQPSNVPPHPHSGPDSGPTYSTSDCYIPQSSYTYPEQNSQWSPWVQPRHSTSSFAHDMTSDFCPWVQPQMPTSSFAHDMTSDWSPWVQPRHSTSSFAHDMTSDFFNKYQTPNPNVFPDEGPSTGF